MSNGFFDQHGTWIPQASPRQGPCTCEPCVQARQDELALAVMDDDGFGCAITSTPEQVWACSCGCGSVIKLDAEAGWLPARPAA